MHSKKGIKRILVGLMLLASPFAYSDPISLFQETLPPVTPKIIFHVLKEDVPVPSLKKKIKQKSEVRISKPETNQNVKKKKKSNLSKFGFRHSGLKVTGIASWYSQVDPFINRHTANGEVFNDRKLTCASWDHSFGTYLEVTNLANGKSVVCRVNDRGPNKRLRRTVDLTLGAFRKIAEPNQGLIRVSVSKLSK